MLFEQTFFSINYLVIVGDRSLCFPFSMGGEAEERTLCVVEARVSAGILYGVFGFVGGCGSKRQRLRDDRRAFDE